MEALFLNLTRTQAGEAVCSRWQSSSEGASGLGQAAAPRSGPQVGPEPLTNEVYIL